MADLDLLGAELRRQLPPAPERLLVSQRARLDADPRARIPPPRRLTLPLAAAGGGALLALVLVFAALLRPAVPPSLLAGIAARQPRVELGLDDGTRIRLERGAHGKIAEQGALGVRFHLERGRATFDVAPQGSRRFRVTAGDHEVSVIGTRFSVSFEPPNQLSVTVESGLVAVRTGDEREIRLGPGQRYESVAASSPSVAPSAAIDTPASSALPPASSDDRLVKPGWRDLYTRRNYRAALEAARQLGFESLTSSLGADQLAELADAARLAGAGADALVALKALERRFPGTQQGRQAPFLIGRVLLLSGNQSAAIPAFERYLRTNPEGAYTSEAMGRLLELYAGQGDRTRARDMARRYLARAPSGPYQRLARSLLIPR
jgi:hypothetical protein